MSDPGSEERFARAAKRVESKQGYSVNWTEEESDDEWRIGIMWHTVLWFVILAIIIGTTTIFIYNNNQPQP